MRLLAGKPLIGRTVEAACAAEMIDRVVVSTDDIEIAETAREHGAETVDRPASLSGDRASSESALIHTLDHLRDTESYEPDLTVFLQCTSPLTLPKDIDGTVHTLLDKEADSALTVSPSHRFFWHIEESGVAHAINHNPSERLRRQDRAAQYVETGAAYVIRTTGFLKAKHRFFGKTVAHVVPRTRSLEIDDAMDLRLAETLAKKHQRTARGRALPDPIEAVIFDFDGVFTDNKVTVFQDEREAVVCNRSDGLGIEMLRETGLPTLILSTEVHPVVRARANKLCLDVIHGVDDKMGLLDGWLRERGISWKHTVFTGNDLNDLACIKRAGCGVAVADAYPRVRRAANLLLTRRGGDGAVRELCDLILDSLKLAPTSTERDK